MKSFEIWKQERKRRVKVENSALREKDSTEKSSDMECGDIECDSECDFE